MGECEAAHTQHEGAVQVNGAMRKGGVAGNRSGRPQRFPGAALAEVAGAAAPAGGVAIAQADEAAVVSGVGDVCGGHDEGIFVVVGVVALAHAGLAEAVLGVEGLGAEVGGADFQREGAHAAPQGGFDAAKEEQFADAVAAGGLADADDGDVSIVDDVPEAKEAGDALGEVGRGRVVAGEAFDAAHQALKDGRRVAGLADGAEGACFRVSVGRGAGFAGDKEEHGVAAKVTLEGGGHPAGGKALTFYQGDLGDIFQAHGPEEEGHGDLEKPGGGRGVLHGFSGF